MTYLLKITGKVQGVCYRVWAKGAAKELGLTGFVRNDMRGPVIIQVTGHEDALQEFIEKCRRGPKYADVEHVEVQEIENAEEYDTFEIHKS